jgi:hypothetical protein
VRVIARSWALPDLLAAIATEDVARDILGRGPQDTACILHHLEPALVVGRGRVETIGAHLKVHHETESATDIRRSRCARIER